ncbi:hypothetical protein Lal_00000827 [Lupinus albus]|nr:hypothetical protein Lal_00000827 [Lupinus albus]
MTKKYGIGLNKEKISRVEFRVVTLSLLKDDREYIEALREAKDWGLVLSDEQLQNLILLEIEKLPQRNRRSWKDYPPMPYPNGYVTNQLGSRLIYEELNYDSNVLKEKFNLLFQSLTDEQSKIFHTIIQAVNRQQGHMFFLYCYGGTGGRTAHSKFKIHVPTLENSICNVHQGFELAELLKQTKLIIWDEASMAHKFCFEALDRSLADIMGTTSNESILFGGNVVVFGGVPRGCRSDIVHTTINSSYLWHRWKILTLSKNMCLQNNDNASEIKEFSEWILNVGDGKLSEPNDGCVEVDIPEELLILDFDNPIDAIDEEYLQSKAILASTIEIVDQINDYVLSIIPSEEKEYLSSDEVDMFDVNNVETINILTLEFLNKLSTSGLPNHKIWLKVGTPIMLLRNLDQAERLCNGTRLVVTRMTKLVLETKIMLGKNTRNILYIPRMSMSSSQSSWTFKMIRRQFPISLESVGLYLPRPVFSHEQLYVVISRVQSKKGLKILIHDKDFQPLKSTTNIVYKEVFKIYNMYFITSLIL